jgi:hypothetical protein
MNDVLAPTRILDSEADVHAVRHKQEIDELLRQSDHGCLNAR